MDKKKEEIYQHVYSLTLQQLQSSNMKTLGSDALNISMDMHMDRSNTSRLLNQLHQEGRLIKIQGRPTLFIARMPLENQDPDSYIPSIIPKGKHIIDYVKIKPLPETSPDKEDCFRRYIANRKTSSMYEPILHAKAALRYPPHGLNVFIYGDPCVGKLLFAKTMYEYSILAHLCPDHARMITLDCMNYESQSTEELLSALYGSFDGEHLKKGAFDQAKHGILILNHLDTLSFSTLTHIYNAIINQSHTPIGLPTKQIPMKCLIIGISNSENLIKNPDIRRCFPMQIRIPSLREKSIQEMLVLTMQYFQEEAVRIDKTLRISKGALSCFVMSDYSGNLPHLHAEIKQACAHAFYSYQEEESLFVNIDYDDISTPVLTDIYDVNERINELDNILNLFDNEFIFFSPLQESEELDLLFDLSNKTDKNDLYLRPIDDKLINSCIQDINAAISIHLNTIRSIMLKQIYDTVYPILQNGTICTNENLLYGLLLHISNTISRLKSGRTDSGFKSSDYRIAKEEDYAYARQIAEQIQRQYDISLPDEELDYIATYLYLSSQWIDNRYIQLLIVTEGKDGKDYADYLNSQNIKSHVSWLRINNTQSADINCRRIASAMNEINRDKGVVLATNSQLVESYEPLLTHLSDTEFVMVPNISLKLLVSIAEKIESLGVTITSMKYFRQEDHQEQLNMNQTETHAQELLNKITDKVLTESLVFLNPHKVCQSLFNVLINILHDLNIPYVDDLLIKFIFHSGFTIERCIRKEPLTYPKARTIINENANTYYMVEKNFEIISEIFNVTIPSSEMAMIMEIFLPYLQI